MSTPVNSPQNGASPNSPPPARPQENAWALRIATVAGIPIRLHFTFLLFLLWVGLAGRNGGSGLSVWYVLAIFACVVLHELGHSLVALRYGIPVSSITLYPIGGVAMIEKRPTAKQELWIAIAGPAVNVVIALALFLITGLPHLTREGALLANGGGGLNAFLARLLLFNIWMVAFNMIPAFPMDGGRVLRAILAHYTAPERATAIAASVGQFIAIVLGIWAIFSGQWMLMFIAFFVFIGAGQEAFAYKQASLVEGVSVRQAMITDVRTLTGGNTLKEAADMLLDTSQHDFPVVLGDEVQGVLTRNGLLRALSQEGPGAYVAGAMNREFQSVGPDDDLGELLPQLGNGAGPLVVLEPGPDRRLLGMVTGENVQEFFAVRQIVNARNVSQGPPFPR